MENRTDSRASGEPTREARPGAGRTGPGPLGVAPESAAAARYAALPGQRPPRALAELGAAEALLLRSLRLWIVGLQRQDHHAWSMAWNELARSLGGTRARDLLGTLTALVHALCGHVRRPIAYHQPCCPCLGADELCLLALVAACQRGGAGDAAALRAAWLVSREGVPVLVEAAGALAKALAEGGLWLDAGTSAGSEAPRPESGKGPPVSKDSIVGHG